VSILLLQHRKKRRKSSSSLDFQGRRNSLVITAAQLATGSLAKGKQMMCFTRQKSASGWFDTDTAG
jgi:hypothetical protein